jgi:hypothetical protein
MSLIIKDPLASRLVLRRTWQPMDPDAAAYITAVEAADTAAGSPGGLEERTKIAIDDFVLGCKADGIWTAIKASCILAGARTLAGALQPLVGTAPTNFNFVAGDYNRKTGLVGNGSTKFLNSNRAGNADPQSNRHLSVYASALPTTATKPLAGQARIVTSGVHFIYNNISRFGGNVSDNYTAATGFIGLSRSQSANYIRRNNLTTDFVAQTSNAPIAGNYYLFRDGEANAVYGDARLAFYSIGESLDLALLDARVTDLINAFATAIP